jgi:hypothetical protein
MSISISEKKENNERSTKNVKLSLLHIKLKIQKTPWFQSFYVVPLYAAYIYRPRFLWYIYLSELVVLDLLQFKKKKTDSRMKVCRKSDTTS